jgi:Uma2 family endonuclease
LRCFRRNKGGWLQEIAAAGGSVLLTSLGFGLTLEAIYEDSDVPALSAKAEF